MFSEKETPTMHLACCTRTDEKSRRKKENRQPSCFWWHIETTVCVFCPCFSL